MHSTSLPQTSQYTSKVVVSGFDGYIDRILRVKQSKDQFFSTLDEFGQYIKGKAQKSCSLELKPMAEKIGGNMPIFSLALAKLGVPVKCIGALGFPAPHPLFQNMDANCQLHSVCNPGRCQALEFDDGKLMLADNEEIERLDFPLLLDRIGKEALVSLYESSSLIALLNWSELSGSLSIWNGLKDEIFPLLSPQNRLAFIDLSDCSGRSVQDIQQACELIRGFSNCFDLTVSLNRNEAEILAQALGVCYDSFESLTGQLQDRLQCARLVIHMLDCSYFIHRESVQRRENFHVTHPVISTGGGDNFNAGFAYGLLQELPIMDCVDLAHYVSGFYVSHGWSPSRNELDQWIEHLKNNHPAY